MFERVTLLGRVGQDPKMRYTPDGVPVTDFSLATTSRRSKDKPCPEGWVESYNKRFWELTTWWRVTCWRGLAEVVNQYVNKGDQIFVEGQVKGEASDGKQEPRVWTGSDGVARASYELTARTIKFLGSGKADGEAASELPADSLPF